MNQDRIWSHFQNEGADSFAGALPRLQFLRKQVLKHCGKKAVVLNVGVGSGALEHLLAKAGCTPVSLDPDARAIARMQEAGLAAYVGRIEAMPFEDAQLDAVVVSEVLEHLPAEVREAALAEIARVLKPGGHLFVTVPYQENLPDSQVVCPACGNDFHRWGHTESFSSAALRAELAPHFQVKSVCRRAFVSFSGGPKRKLKSAFKAILGRLGEQIVNPTLFAHARKQA